MMVDPCNGILLSNKRNELLIHINMDDCQNTYTLWEKPNKRVPGSRFNLHKTLKNENL